MKAKVMGNNHIFLNWSAGSKWKAQTGD